MPPEGHGHHGVGVGADGVEQQAGGHHTQEHARDDTPRGNAGPQQHKTTQQGGQGGHLTNAALHIAEKRVEPGQRLTPGVGQCIHPTLCGLAERSSATETVHGGPYAITGDLRRVGEEQEGPSRQRGVEEVFAGAAKHFLAHDDAEADTQRHLPQGNVGRQDERKQDGCDEETLVDLVAANGRKQHFPEAADDEGDGVNW